MFINKTKIVEKIHAEFDSAEDKLLKEANDILSSLNISSQSKIEDKANRLKRVGFTNSPLIKQAKELKKKVDMNQQQAALIQYYKQHYPSQKFLTEQELDRICNKYNLIYAPISNYIEEIPEKNLLEIENVRELAGSDVPTDKIMLYGENMSNYPRYHMLHEEQLEELKKGIDVTELSTTFRTDDRIVEMYYEVEQVWLKSKRITQNRQGLFIAAPKSHFNLKGLKKNKLGYFFQTVIETKDPIVFRYVKGGIQVITKWGLEANDELLIN